MRRSQLPTAGIPDSSCRDERRGGGVAIWARRRRRRADGVVTVEAALIVPILLLLTFGMIEYGWLFLKSQEITNAARRGVRVAIRADATTGEVTTAIGDALSVAGLGGSGYQVTITPSDVAGAATGDVIAVQITLPYDGVALMGTSLVPTPANIQASVSMAKEGP